MFIPYMPWHNVGAIANVRTQKAFICFLAFMNKTFHYCLESRLWIGRTSRLMSFAYRLIWLAFQAMPAIVSAPAADHCVGWLTV